MQEVSRPAAAAATPRVLVIDDSRVIRTSVQRILGKEFDLSEAEDGEAGWEQLLADPGIEVVVSDIEMPRLDGYSLLCRIRAAEETRVRDVPVIVITGAQDEQTRERALACGATDFITKPLDGVQLLARTRAHARLDQTVRRLAETEATLESESSTDTLTGLHSRRYFLQRGAQDLAYARRHTTELSVILLEIDDYARHQQRLGATAAEQIQKWLAAILRQTTRTEDTAVRLGEGLFGVIAPSAGRVAAAVLCERARAAVSETPSLHEGQPLGATVSLGFSTLGRDADDSIETLLRVADQRLILAKAAGGNRMGSLYQDDMPGPEEAVMEMPDLETALAMLEKGEAGKLLPYIPELTMRVLPLLEQCNAQLGLDLAMEIEALRERLATLR